MIRRFRPIGRAQPALPIAMVASAAALTVAWPALAAPRLIGGRVGHWSLRDLGARPPLRIDPQHRTARVRFRLPPDTRQGTPLWYLARLQASVRFARGVSGKFLLTADVNGATVAQIPIVVRARSLRLEELGLVEGRRSRIVAGKRARIDFRNYIQITAIRGGTNALRFAMEPLAVHGLSRTGAFAVAVRGGSGIEATGVLPDELLLQAEPPAVTAQVGEAVNVGYALMRRGGRPDGPVDVRFSAGGLELRGSDVQRYPRIGAGIRGAFTVVGGAPGTYMTMVAVPDRFNEPSTPVTVTIVASSPAAAGTGGRIGRIGGGGLLVVAGLTLLLRRRLRGPSQLPHAS
jgi:hypothetical protein